MIRMQKNKSKPTRILACESDVEGDLAVGVVERLALVGRTEDTVRVAVVSSAFVVKLAALRVAVM